MITGVLTLPFANSLHSRPYLRLTFPQRNDFTGLTLIIDAESPVPICVDGGLYKPAPLPLDIDLKEKLDRATGRFSMLSKTKLINSLLHRYFHAVETGKDFIQMP